ncbi:MAG TPA: SAF domain-containing protein, partial [Nocardioides sp.]|nr:SAF domain-containing protein [Nocardioides sp.]
MLLVVAAVIAALGVALVFVYARGADARAAEKYETVEVLVASKKISPGESVDDALANGKISLVKVAQKQVLADAGDDSAPFQGKVALTTIYPNEQLIPSKFGAV